VITVLVVDDHDLIRAGISRLLSDTPTIKVVGNAKNGEEAIKMARELKPNVVLMDLKMPGIGGLEATRKLLKAVSGTKVIALTSCEEDPFPTKLLQAGASGYLTKGALVDEMVSAIHSVMEGKRYISPVIAQQLALKTVTSGEGSPFNSLSEREMQVTLMITRGQKVQEIAETLCVSPKTVNSYRYRIFEKLKVSSDVELTHHAIRHGIVDTESS
jgi:two-component system invasion response regulator UvrY